MTKKKETSPTPEELEAMADALLAADGKPAKTKEERIQELIEKGKKAGKLSAEDLAALEELQLTPEEQEKLDEKLAGLNIDAAGDDTLPPLDDVVPELEEIQEIEEITEEELADTDAMADTFSTDDPVRMYLKEIGKVPLLSPTSVSSSALPSAMSAAACCFSI